MSDAAAGTSASSDAHLDQRAFDALGMQSVDSTSIDAAVAAAGDKLVCVFFWGVDCFNCEMAKKAILASMMRSESRFFAKNSPH
ncbi:hypothetical protein LMG23994_02916 [Cupriavidus pinatubonensis]|uniref:Thioredoxin domain-containing protein n=1 Tax=Cupriavidus pinatubonensis TaxID=248026 RepID=A0ABM8X3Q0_9BURK|nr:hypothetical protein LMG23994_02916 [Cupriavidus pinatubonensis]